MNAREIAVKLLRSYEENDSYVNLSLNSSLVSSLSAEEFDKYGDEYVKKTYRELDEFYKAVKKTVIGE